MRQLFSILLAVWVLLTSAGQAAFFNPSSYGGGFYGGGFDLSQIGTAEAAYSVRKLRDAYTGSALRVRRSSDNAEQDIGFSGGGLDTSALTTFCGANSCYVKTWYDQSGNSRNATQTTAGSQPRIVNAGTLETQTNGAPAIRTVAGSNHYLSATVTIAQPYTEFIVARRPTPIGGGTEVLSGGAGYRGGFMASSSDGYFQIQAGTDLPSTGVVMPQITFASTALFNGANSKIYKEGTEIASGNTGTDSITAPFEIGGWVSGDNGGDFVISEVVLFGSALSTANRQVLETNQIGYYDIHTLDFYDWWGSHWFDPIPASATYTSFQVAGDTEPGLVAANYDYDINYEIEATNADAVEDLLVPGAWDDRDSGAIWQASIHVPNDFVLPDASPGNTPNNPTIILNTTTGAASFLNGCARPTAGGSIWGYQSTPNMTHNGSGTIGGQVNQSELDDGVIGHAIALNVWGEKYLSNTGGGFVSPAIKADSNYDDPESAEYYGGNVANLKMGSRLAIPSDVTAASLGITSPDALAVFNAAKTYGFIIVDNTAFDAVAIHTDTDAAVSLLAVESELAAIYQALEIVE